MSTTVWGVRYPQPIERVYRNGIPFAVSAGHIVWSASEIGARERLAVEQAAGFPVELVRITGRVRHADDTATSGGAR